MTINNNLDKPRKKFEFNIEALRGMAALIVVFGHIFYNKGILDPSFKAQLIGDYIPPAHLSVLLFFVLSGYVIGISNPKPLKTKLDIFQYLKKRLIRLYPIYLISLLIIVPFVYKSGIGAFVKHLIFGQNLLCWVYFQNSPLWSLNYEVIYYILFIVISYLELSPKIILYGLASIGIACVILFKLHPHYYVSLFSGYLIGFFFWVSGLLMAKQVFKKKEKISYGLYLSLLFFILSASYQIIKLPEYYKNYFHATGGITLQDLLYLPFCIYFILVFCNANFRYRRILTIIIFLLPLVKFFPSIYNLYIPDSQKIQLVFYLLSLCLLINTKIINYLSAKIISLFIYLGSISYAIYVIHFPIMAYFNKVKLFSGSHLTFSIRLSLFCFVIFSISILLEKYLQPWIREKIIATGSEGSKNLKTNGLI